MNLSDAIIACREIDDKDNLVIYAEKIDGKFSPDSEAVLLELSEEEMKVPVSEVSSRKCQGFDYGLEVFLIKELIEDLSPLKTGSEVTHIVDKIIYYMENDAYYCS